MSSTPERRAIGGWPGYEIDSMGTVWSCRTNAILGTNWKVLQPSNRKGYLSALLQNNGVRKRHMVAHLVLTAFVGPCPLGHESLHYPDPNPLNNNLSNLRWGTPSENGMDKVRLNRQARGSKHGKAKLSEADVIMIRAEFRPGTRNGKPPSNAIDLGKKFGVTPEQISRVARGGYWGSNAAPLPLIQPGQQRLKIES